jgi:hypothetical protein
VVIDFLNEPFDSMMSIKDFGILAGIFEVFLCLGTQNFEYLSS